MHLPYESSYWASTYREASLRRSWLGKSLLIRKINISGHVPTKLTWPFMGHLSDTYNCWLRMHRECRECFHRHWLQRKPLVSDPDMHYGTCVTSAAGKRSRHSRRMRNPQFYVSGTRPMTPSPLKPKFNLQVPIIHTFQYIAEQRLR